MGTADSTAGDAMPRAFDRLAAPFRVFAANKLAGAVLLMVAAVVAIVWANSPWAASYFAWLSAPLSVGVGGAALEKPILLWINDGLMGVFFFHVGLEIKRELLAGELSTARKAALPAIAAVGGMVVPACLYFAINAGLPTARGWGIPMATDIAFALGVLALLGDRVPVGLKVFLTALAIVDDIGAILVIALFYTEDLAVTSLAIGLGLYAIAIALNRAHVRSPIAYFILGTLVWLAFLKSGVHATVAALLMAFTIPSRTRVDGARFIERLQHHVAELRRVGVPEDHGINTVEQQHALDGVSEAAQDAGAPLLRLEHALVPVVTFLVMPIFALANAGVAIEGDLMDAVTSPITIGIVVGLFLGKQVGVSLFTWLAVRLRVADLPHGVTWLQIYGASLLAGVGFTMSLFIAGLAFPDPATLNLAKVGILAASLVAAILGFAAVRRATREPPSAE